MTSQSIKCFSFVVMAGTGLLCASLLTVSMAHAQVSIGNDGVKFPDDTIQTTAHKSYAIGDTGPGGGFVFFVNVGGYHGLEAAPADQSTGTAWCGTLTDIDGVENLASSGDVDPNSGYFNTPLIVDVCGATSAAGVAADYVWPNGQTDGFLPNKEELDLMYQKKDDIGGFAVELYWSSSEFNDLLAWLQTFANGTQDNLNKSNTNRVRAVRAF